MALQLIVEAGSQAGRVIDLHEGDNVIGRSAESEIRIGGADVSRKHVVIRVAGQKAVAENLSRFGTRLDAARMDTPTVLEDGQRLMLGFDTVLRFSGQAGEGSEEQQTGPGAAADIKTPTAGSGVHPVGGTPTDSAAGALPVVPPPPSPAPAEAVPAPHPAPVSPPPPLAHPPPPPPPAPVVPPPSPAPTAPLRSAPPPQLAKAGGDFILRGDLLSSDAPPAGEEPSADELEPASGHIDFKVAPDELGDAEEPMSMAVIGLEEAILRRRMPAAAAPEAPPAPAPAAAVSGSAARAASAEADEDADGPHTRMMSVDAVQYLRGRQEKRARLRMVWIGLAVAGAILLAILVIWNV